MGKIYLRGNIMAEQEKDTFWIKIGALIVITIVLVLMLKSRETEHLTGAQELLDQEVEAQMRAEGQPVD